MLLQKIHNSTFRRIASQIGHYINRDHFLGQNAIQGITHSKTAFGNKSKIKITKLSNND